MFSKYIVDQPIVCKTLGNMIEGNRLSHAYLFESNGYKDSLFLAKDFVKRILCKDNIDLESNVENECIIIEPEGLWIKKSQLEVLQKEFSEKSVVFDKKVYIINHAERLNEQAANSILKFLEEPEDNIIAILISDNIYQLLDTIISRCQVVSFKKNNLCDLSLIDKIKHSIKIEIEDEKLLEVLNNVIIFLNYYEKNKEDTILHTKKLWHNNFKEKDEVLLAFNFMILIYKDALNYLIKKKTDILDFKHINFLLENNIVELSKKIEVILKTMLKINNNINSSLLIDKLIIDLKRSEKDD